MPSLARDDRRQWLALVLTPGLGAIGIKKLLERFGSAAAVLAAGEKALAASGLLRKESLAFLAGSKATALTTATAEIDRAEKQGVELLCLTDPRFPPLLKQLADPPPVLYLKGDPAWLSRPSLAIVGARAASGYGLQVAGRLAGELAREGMVIISGLALGIDSAAHRGALAAAGKTVAVLGCGLDIIYPPQNKKLYDELFANGVLLTEYPMGTQPDNFRFPARNRIISGLSLGVVVVEAARRSGTLITAHQAIDQGREVFAVPGRIDSVKSEGCHRLIQEGAKLVHSAADILEELRPGFRRAEPVTLATAPMPQQLPGEEGRIFSMLGVYPKNIEEIIAASDLPAGRIAELLLLLELKGLVIALPGKHYQVLAQSGPSGV